ncbi:MAG: hypothetical protein IJ033_03860 [Clostridia bacterium]|nr:hypothetical protein [Clostridia bacterium]
MKNGIKYTLFSAGGLLGGVGISAIVYLLTKGNVDWENYLTAELMPALVSTTASIGALALAVTPIINKINGTTSLFTQATKDVNESVANTKESQQVLAEREERIASFQEEQKELREAVNNMNTMIRIAFTNMDELVRKGMAKEINKVGAKDEYSETTD